MCAPDARHSALDALIAACHGSPRGLLRLCDVLIERHVSVDKAGPYLSWKDVFAVLSNPPRLESGAPAASVVSPSEASDASERSERPHTGGISRDMLVRLRRIFVASFDPEDLRTICFEMDINHQIFSQSFKSMARELIEYCEVRNRARELVQTARRLRPDIDWDAELG
jgi:hypothetical protein